MSQQFDNRCVLSDYAATERSANLSITTCSVLVNYLWDNSRTMRPKGLKKMVNPEEHQSGSFLAMSDVITDAINFDYNRRDEDYKNFHYALDTSKPRGRKLRKCFS
jgi:hypothetical protein